MNRRWNKRNQPRSFSRNYDSWCNNAAIFNYTEHNVSIRMAFSPRQISRFYSGILWQKRLCLPSTITTNKKTKSRAQGTLAYKYHWGARRRSFQCTGDLFARKTKVPANPMDRRKMIVAVGHRAGNRTDLSIRNAIGFSKPREYFPPTGCFIDNGD